MNPHDAILLGIGALAGTLALLLMQGARSYGRRDVEGELVGALNQIYIVCCDNAPASCDQRLALAFVADVAHGAITIAEWTGFIATETNRGPLVDGPETVRRRRPSPPA
jgi:hypothetical protein